MERLPFSVYDFFGYLSAGFLIMVATSSAFVGEAPLEDNPNFTLAILLVVLAYICGQVIATLAGFWLEGLLVGKAIKRPTDHLFGDYNTGTRECLFPAYCTALPQPTQERVRATAREFGLPAGDRKALFYHCHARVKKEPVPQERLATFLNLYGFCRNCSLALLLGGAALFAGSLHGSAETGIVSPGWWVGGALLCAVVLFYRYLKFFRHYALEVFTSYAEGD